MKSWNENESENWKWKWKMKTKNGVKDENCKLEITKIKLSFK